MLLANDDTWKNDEGLGETSTQTIIGSVHVFYN